MKGNSSMKLDTETHREQSPIKYPGLLFIAVVGLFVLAAHVWAIL